MARCKLTNMNLRNIRKSREYQCLLIDFVKVGVIGKTAAEGLLGYTIPSGLISGGNSAVTPEPEDDEDDDDPEETEPNTINVIYNSGDEFSSPKSYILTPGDTVENLLIWAKSESGFDVAVINTVTPAFLVAGEEGSNDYQLQDVYKTHDTTALLSDIIQDATEDYNSEALVLVVSAEAAVPVEG